MSSQNVIENYNGVCLQLYSWRIITMVNMVAVFNMSSLLYCIHNQLFDRRKHYGVLVHNFNNRGCFYGTSLSWYDWWLNRQYCLSQLWMQSKKTIVEVLIMAFNLAFCQAKDSYVQYHNFIHAIVCDVLRGWIKRIGPYDQHFEITALFKVV